MTRPFFLFFLAIALYVPGTLRAQVKQTSIHKFALPADALASLSAKEDSLVHIGDQMINGREPSDRFSADSLFTRTLVRALKVNHSFAYPFDSLATVSHLYAPDSSFRLFTWQISMDDDSFRRHGAIQIRTADGSLKLFGLIDRTSVMDHPMDTVTSNDYWVGNIYYKIIEKKYNGKKYYTLLGYDEHDFRSTRKWIDVLTFNEDGRPVFGGPYFSFIAGDTAHPANPIARFMLEYKKDGEARIQYDADLDLILYDHLISESNESDKRYTLIPDGDYEGFRWVNGKWLHINKVFTQKLLNGQAPVPHPLSDPSAIHH